MTIKRINDCMLDDRLAEGRSFAVLFIEPDRPTCRSGRREFGRLSLDYPEIPFLEIDLLENPSLADRFGITLIPTTLVFIRGREATRHRGTNIRPSIGGMLGPHPLPGDDR
jgi:hypothetical protein